MNVRGWAIVGILAIVASLLIATLHFRNETTQASSALRTMTTDRDRLQKLNEANAKEAARDLAAARANVVIVDRVVEVEKKSTEGQARDRAAISKARRNDANVGEILDAPVPDAVRCVLNGTCPASGAGAGPR